MYTICGWWRHFPEKSGKESSVEIGPKIRSGPSTLLPTFLFSVGEEAKGPSFHPCHAERAILRRTKKVFFHPPPAKAKRTLNRNGGSRVCWASTDPKMNALWGSEEKAHRNCCVDMTCCIHLRTDSGGGRNRRRRPRFTLGNEEEEEGGGFLPVPSSQLEAGYPDTQGSNQVRD